MERLQKVLAQAGVASRRKCEEWIVAGKISVNGIIVRELGTKVDPAKDLILVEGKPIHKEQYVYILLNKPIGVVTTAFDPQGRKTVIDIVPVKERVFPVGRLDMNTSGLLLLTNDGALANGLMHPRHKVNKHYLTKVEGFLSNESIVRLEKGIQLEDGLTAPASVTLINRSDRTSLFKIVIHEGRNRQVRRMCEAVGHPVISLKRVQLSFLELGKLQLGEWRYLENQEVKRLYEIAGTEQKSK